MAQGSNPDEPRDSEPPAPPSGEGARRGVFGRVWLVVLLTVLVVAAGTLAFLQWRRARDLASEQDRRDEVSETAAQFGEALLSYDYTDLGAARERVISMSTDEFTELYDQAFVVGLEPAITQLQAVSSGTVRKIYVTDVSSTDASAIVIVDSEVTTSAGTRRLLGSYLDMEFVRVNERWRVNSVTALTADSETLVPGAETPPAGGATTTTAAAG